MIFVYVIMT